MVPSRHLLGPFLPKLEVTDRSLFTEQGKGRAKLHCQNDSVPGDDMEIIEIDTRKKPGRGGKSFQRGNDIKDETKAQRFRERTPAGKIGYQWFALDRRSNERQGSIVSLCRDEDRACDRVGKASIQFKTLKD